jgi:hypothetical protein
MAHPVWLLAAAALALAATAAATSVSVDFAQTQPLQHFWQASHWLQPG